MVITHFKSNCRFSFCRFCRDPSTCEGNLLIGRIVLLVLKNLRIFRRREFIDRSLVSVLGSQLVDDFFSGFCVPTGDCEGFSNRIFRCTLSPSATVMPQLSLRTEDLSFVFSHKDLYGETEIELIDRINSQAVRDHAT